MWAASTWRLVILCGSHVTWRTWRANRRGDFLICATSTSSTVGKDTTAAAAAARGNSASITARRPPGTPDIGRYNRFTGVSWADVINDVIVVVRYDVIDHVCGARWLIQGAREPAAGRSDIKSKFIAPNVATDCVRYGEAPRRKNGRDRRTGGESCGHMQRRRSSSANKFLVCYGAGRTTRPVAREIENVENLRSSVYSGNAVNVTAVMLYVAGSLAGWPSREIIV